MTLATLARMITAKHKSKYLARLWAVSLAFARLARTHVALPHVEHVEATAAASVAMHFHACAAVEAHAALGQSLARPLWTWLSQIDAATGSACATMASAV
jgi:hypothetical protein